MSSGLWEKQRRLETEALRRARKRAACSVVLSIYEATSRGPYLMRATAREVAR
jgi:hypothetical protein